MELDLNIDSNGNVIVNTLSEYVAYISQLQAANEGSNERFFFRGQSNKNWDVRPCLFRENNLTIESDIISEACARAPFEFGGRSAFERLTKLQHYGLPTRMLDVTLNPLVALYFACAKCEDKENYDKNYKESDTIDVDSDHSFDNEYDVDGAVYYRRAYGHKHNSDDIDLLARIAEMDFSGDIVLHQLVEKLGLRSQIKQAEDFEELAKVMQNAYFDLLAELNYKRFMFKKLCILLIFSKLNEIKHLIDKYRMHNLYAIFAKLLNICKQIAGNLVNESGNVPRRGVVPKFSDLEVVALNMASEAVGIDSESLLFANLQEYRVEIPNLISRRQYNDRRKITSSLCNAIRERMVAKMDGGEDYFCIDSKPIEVCRIARSKRCSMGKKDFSKAPGVGYCASQSMYYYGYKLHAVCGLSGVIHSFDLTKASVHDIHYLKDVKVDYSNCTVIGDRGYISAQVQLDLFETANIRLEVPYRCNQKEWKPTFPAFAKARKRIETLFSQLCDQFMIIRNYAKDTDGLFARIIGKISALTILQYINYKNEKPIGRVKYALF